MKKLKWIFGILFILAAMIGCEKEMTNDVTPDAFLKSAKVKTEVFIATNEVITVLPEVCGYEEFELLGGQDIDCGDVIIANDGEYLYIYIHSVDGFDDVEENVKIWLGTEDPIIVFGDKRPVSGKFPYKYDAEGLDFTAKFLLADFIGANSICEDYTPIYAVIHVDAVVDNGDTELDVDGNEVLANTETAYAGTTPDDIITGSAWWYNVSYDPVCCVGDPIDLATGCAEETAWGGDYTDGTKPWWFTFDVANGNMQGIYAGQKVVEGASVTYIDGIVTITLGDHMELKNVDEPVKIEGYTVKTLPKGRPATGHFTYKGTELVVEVGVFNYLAVHLDVIVCDE